MICPILNIHMLYPFHEQIILCLLFMLPLRKPCDICQILLRKTRLVVCIDKPYILFTEI